MQHIFIVFIVYSFIGWLWESIFCSLKSKHFVYRGFLLGPYCPVYGFGVVSVLLLVPKDAGTLLNLCFNAIVIVTIVEYLTSWLLEKLFNMQLWNYSKVPFNLNGRVAIPVSCFWGIGCLFLIKVIHPIIDFEISKFISYTNNWGWILILILFILDVISTLTFTLTTKPEVISAIDQSDKENASIKEYRLQHLFINHKESKHQKEIKNHLKLTSSKQKMKHLGIRRLIKNYPNIKFK